jgi:hypothetical protein
VGDEHLHHLLPLGRIGGQHILLGEPPPALRAEQQVQGDGRLRVLGQQEVGVLQLGRVLDVPGDQEVCRQQPVGLVVGHRDYALVDHAHEQDRRRRPLLLGERR